MGEVVLLTGPTGFLGTQVARRLLTQTDRTIVALVRADDREEAINILSRTWSDYSELASAIGGRVMVRCGDIVRPHLGLLEAEHEELISRTTHIIHTAADIRLTAPLVELRLTNVQGVAQVLELARAIQQDHGLSRLTHVSTAYVCGRRSGPVREDELCPDAGFGSAYEQSKCEGEFLVQAARETLPVSVVRPAMIVGDSCTGAIKTFNAVYFPLRLYLTGKLRVLPMSSSLRVNMIPVDYVAASIVRLTFDARATGMTFHLTASQDTLPTAEEFMCEVRHWTREHLDLSLPRLFFAPLIPGKSRPRWLRPGHLTRTLDNVLDLAPYFSGRQEFLRGNTDRLLGQYDLCWRDLLPHLLQFAVDQGFMHRSGRTVHEQIAYRLHSKSLPVSYYDVAAGRVHRRDAQDVLEEVSGCVGALHSLDIGPGDRVAIVGLNSSRYLAIDVALGLVGAVSVPLYYTSPAADIDALLQESGARLLMIGVPALLEHLDELHTPLPKVSFCRQSPTHVLPDTVLSWEKFLDRGAGCDQVTRSTAGFGDHATIRYTSGTTGRPKGAIFTHQQLRWMGSTTASLLPWRARTHPATYLSFLPMNHVVEGILAAYASYYIPAPLSVYFLEDFHELPTVLPRVRPTIFFSVPRLYEKIWDGFMAGRLGKMYAQLPRGLRRTLRPLVRKLVLRRAGLDRCAQLIVGSAPVRDELVLAFHELGIELHNAYGETEAPLVSLNRLGANAIGTAGRPLPRTEVRVAADGELLVRGPQVTVGYCHTSEPPVVDGWLHTGDLGSVTDDGNLIVHGRKKEFIATSYGKKVFPGKLETLLRSITGVDEAMVVGESKPYCVALLWAQAADNSLMFDIDQAVTRLDAGLSHPEQIKRWAILANHLSISSGDLTAKGDLRHQIVGQRFAPVIDCLYAGTHASENVLHYGELDGDGTREAGAPRHPRRSFKLAALGLLAQRLPTFVKRYALEELFACTADALDRPIPPKGRRSYAERLEQYARFTRTEVEVDAAIDEGHDLDAIQARLFERAFHLGHTLKKVFHVTGLEEAMAVSRLLYRTIDIDFEGTADGDVTITHCYFSRFYTSQVCRTISSLDAGMLAGLSGGAQLEFSERITEGCDRCRARLTTAGRAP